MLATPLPRNDAGASSAPARRFLDEKQLAELIGVPVGTLRRWRMFGGGPVFHKLGQARRSHVRYEAAAVERWLTSCIQEQS